MNAQFKDKPGCWERHLKRKYHNPLFPIGQRELDPREIESARARDEKESLDFHGAFQRLLQEMTALERHVDSDVILDIKERIERLYDQCAGLSGERRKEKEGLRRLNELIMQTIRKAAGSDPMALQELDDEQAARDLHYHLLEYPVVSDLLRPDSPVTEEDLIPTLLSEDVEVIRVVMSMFEPAQQQQIQKDAQALVASLPQDTRGLEQLHLKLQALASYLQ